MTLAFFYLAFLSLYLWIFKHNLRAVEFVALCSLPIFYYLYSWQWNGDFLLAPFALSYVIFLWNFAALSRSEKLRRLSGWLLSTGFSVAAAWGALSLGEKRLMLFYMVLGPLYAAFRGNPSENPLRRQEP